MQKKVLFAVIFEVTELSNSLLSMQKEIPILLCL